MKAFVRRGLSGPRLPIGQVVVLVALFFAPLVGHSQALTREPDKGTPPAAPYLAVAETANKEIAAHMGHPLGIPISLVMNPREITVAGPSGSPGSALAYTEVLNSSGGYTGTAARCGIHINPSLYTIKDSSEVTEP